MSGAVSGSQLGFLQRRQLEGKEENETAPKAVGNITGTSPDESPHPLGSGSRTSADFASLFRAKDGLSLSKQSIGSFLFKGPSDQNWPSGT
jgi:hypothetical protein